MSYEALEVREEVSAARQCVRPVQRRPEGDRAFFEERLPKWS